MRRIVGLVLAVAGLAAFLGADTDGESRKVFLVYSTDEQAELAPCG